MKDGFMRRKIIEKIGLIAKKELVYACSKEGKSFHGKKSAADLHSFQWSILAEDTRRTLPTLSSIIDACLHQKPEKKDIVVSLLGGILLKNYNHKVNFIQRLLSVLMYGSHCPKQVKSC